MATVKIIDKDLGFKQIMKSIVGLKTKYVKVGLFGSGSDYNSNNALKGSVQEYGTKDGRIPKRPILRGTFDRKKNNLVGMIGKELRRDIIKKTFDSYDVLLPAGKWLEKQIRVTIYGAIGLKPLAQSTIDRKGTDTVLVETGDLVNHVTTKKGR